ncbi:MAG TPA: hypothetical protein VF666_04580 [Pyrinomonadaceae bacterium]|jgi:hypothetical protein
MKQYSKMIRNTMFAALASVALLLAGATLAAAQGSNTSYKSTKRDPFDKYVPPIKRIKNKKVATPITPPAITERIALYKAKKATAMSAQQPAPKPTTALLINELQVTGIFRTPRGYAAMVEATPIRLSYVIYPGENFYDGLLVAIEEGRLVFRRETPWTDGRKETAVETKPLRQPTVVEEMRTTKTASATTNTNTFSTSSDGALKKEEASSEKGNQ